MILVTGATGLIGRDLVAQLVTAGAPVRALSRHPEAAGLPEPVQVLGGDIVEPDSLRAALADITAVYLFSAGDAGEGFAETAAAAGVKRVVVLSGFGIPDPATVEQPFEAAGVEWTHLRPTAFASNALRWWGEQIRTNGVVYGPYADAATAPIHEADIAAVARVALLHDGHAGARYELTGPESLTFRQQVTQIGQALGREIPFVELTPELARWRMTRTIPEPVVDRLLTAWANAVGCPATVRREVEDLTGSPGRTFSQWARDHAAEFCGAPQLNGDEDEGGVQGGQVIRVGGHHSRAQLTGE